MKVSIVLPARNESRAIGALLKAIRHQLPDAECLVVDDGSTDGTGQIAQTGGARVVRHPYPMGNGAAIKSGARAASGDLIVFMDADGQHDPTDIPRLIGQLEQGYDMVVGARNSGSQANLGRGIANRFYNWLASYMTGRRVEDLTSGFRAVHAGRFREFLPLLPNGFSYPTTITMAFFRAGYLVGYIPITAAKRQGRSHIRPLKDGIRFLLIIFRIATLYSPLKIFVPISATFFALGLGYYIFTFIAYGRFTNMSALLLSTGTLVFLLGLLSEQLTSMLYSLMHPEKR
jgi:glycosyltransferase involved in cell wall biosynthesis